MEEYGNEFGYELNKKTIDEFNYDSNNQTNNELDDKFNDESDSDESNSGRTSDEDDDSPEYKGRFDAFVFSCDTCYRFYLYSYLYAC